MNSTKLFNKNYLKENIKKSKGFITLFLILVPIFTALVTIFLVNEEYYVNVIDKTEIMWVNLIGMYVIPLVISFSLFGYVYKKNSVDFINSMPINRKSIFFTNTIGGILLITIMQVITAVILLICDAFLGNIIIFTQLISDIFVLMWISYIFVFLATNLAMTFSGTFLTQIAITMLILFLVPFCIDSYNGFGIRSVYQTANSTGGFNIEVYKSPQEYTMPYRVFHMIVNGSIGNTEIYSNISILRMIILAILYFALGMFLFQKRKMENTEESFSNVKLHLIVKGLTILPMIIFLNLIDADLEFNIFAVALIGVYYFMFDFIVKRKVHLKLSIPILIVTLLITQGICSGAEFIKEKFPEKNIKREDIVAVFLPNYENGTYYRSVNANMLENDLFIEDEKLIDLLYNSADEASAFLNNNIYENDYKYVYLNVCLKNKLGKTLKTTLTLFDEDYQKILDHINQNEEYVANVKKSFIKNRIINIENLSCNEEEQKIINEEISNFINNTNLKGLYNLNSSGNCEMYLYDYENHTLIKKRVPIDISEKTFEISTSKLNKNTKEMLQKSIEEDLYYGNFYLYNAMNIAINYNRYANTSENMANFIIEHTDEKVDMTKTYYILSGRTMGYNVQNYFFTNNVDEIDKLIIEDNEVWVK